jgi:NAD(P)-dependent dehydrogenase (short-subunit alcohol dehydrogenase family)
MPDEATEMRKQFVGCADAITAFATAQLVGNTCVVAPGYVLTPMQRAEYGDEMRAEVPSKIPLRRHAQREEIAAWFAFLPFDEGQPIACQVYTCDGGETAGGPANR